jgi:hypothetical protein
MWREYGYTLIVVTAFPVYQGNWTWACVSNQTNREVMRKSIQKKLHIQYTKQIGLHCSTTESHQIDSLTKRFMLLMIMIHNVSFESFYSCHHERLLSTIYSFVFLTWFSLIGIDPCIEIELFCFLGSYVIRLVKRNS